MAQHPFSCQIVLDSRDDHGCRSLPRLLLAERVDFSVSLLRSYPNWVTKFQPRLVPHPSTAQAAAFQHTLATPSALWGISPWELGFVIGCGVLTWLPSSAQGVRERRNRF
jgi:hypothetical protein